MEIHLLTSKQFKEITGIKRTTLWRKIKSGKIDIIKISPKKLWFLPPELKIYKNTSFNSKKQH